MGFGVLAYNATAAAAGASNVDLTAATDPDFSARNGHYIFTEDYNLWGVSALETSWTAGRFQVPSWNAIGQFSIFSGNRFLALPANTQLDVWEPYQPPIPKLEELQVQASNNLGAATEISNALIWIATPDFSKNLPRGRLPILVTATLTVTPTLNAWSGGNAISLSTSLRGGVYAVIGATVVGANACWFRIIFPRYRLYRGRKLRPGGFLQKAVGDVFYNQSYPWVMNMGEWGRFQTFELPQIDLFGTVAGAITYTAFLWLVYLGEDLSLLEQGLGGGM
jgi:hypothetical protein